MEEIKVGEYVRTKDGVIAKVCDITEFRTYTEETSALSFAYDTDKKIIAGRDINKHSPNILDLIEMGDVLEIQEIDDEICYIGLTKETTTMNYKDIIKAIKNKEIKLLSVVTNEQFTSIKYEVI